MSEDMELTDYSYLKGRPATEKQLRHLMEDLYYEGPEITDAYEASQLIGRLRSDPVTFARQMYEHRVKTGPEWPLWEKWMLQSRKEYDRDQWRQWWKETRKFGNEAGIVPMQTPPMPEWLKGGNYSTVTAMIQEILRVVDIPNGKPAKIDLIVSSMEDAIHMRERVAHMRKDLRTIEEDAAWTLMRIREAQHGDSLIVELFQQNAEKKSED